MSPKHDSERHREDCLDALLELRERADDIQKLLDSPAFLPTELFYHDLCDLAAQAADCLEVMRVEADPT